jgi:broad specificity phosphatase PhoE
MATLNRIVLIRHGETVGDSSVRYYGRTDVALSDRGREQVRQAALALPGDAFPLVLTSPLARAWQSARIAAPRRRMLLLDELREVDFGEWEGLTAEEIRARDPVRFEEWRQRRPGFAYPGGERTADFQARVDRAVEGMRASGVASILVVVHKGVIRAITRRLARVELPPEQPALGALLQLTRDVSDRWFVGRRGEPRDPNLSS